MGRRQLVERQVVIEGVTPRGHGCGGGIEVPFALPGDVTRVLVGRRRKGRLLEVVQPSTTRVPGRCSHVGQCGGCRWQEMAYEEQLRQKATSVGRLFQGMIGEEARVHPILPCESPWHYRNKMEFSFSMDAAGQRFLGLMASRGRVVDLQECHLVNPWFVECLGAVRQWWAESGLLAYHGHRNEGTLRTLTLREGKRTGDRLAMLTISGRPEDDLNSAQKEALVGCLGEVSVIVRKQVVAKGTPTRFEEEGVAGKGYLGERLEIPGCRPLSFRISPSAFFQPNTKQAEKVYALALDYAGMDRESHVLDLCCGTGTIGLAAASRAGDVVGYDCDADAIRDAQANARRNEVENAQFVMADLREVEPSESADVAFVDPPRAGLPRAALAYLQRSQIKKIVYISCNPASQAQDVKSLLDSGYRLRILHPVDQFPHTPHLENVAVLEV